MCNTLIGGSIARRICGMYTSVWQSLRKEAEEDNLFRTDPIGKQFAEDQISHSSCFYILKENRTYDTRSSAIYRWGTVIHPLTEDGAEITPNRHKLALQFGVLEYKFYDSGEVSGDGHMWSTAAITTDYNERTWPIAYRGNRRTYDFQGTVTKTIPMDNERSRRERSGTRVLGQSSKKWSVIWDLRRIRDCLLGASPR